MKQTQQTPLVCTFLFLLCFSAHAQTAHPEDGKVIDGVYYNSFFSFAFRYPKDWTVHDEEINERIRKRAKEEAVKSGVPQVEAYLLFTASRHPRGTPGIALNPTILIIAENIAPVPRNYTAKNYLLEVRPIKLKEGAQPLLKEPVEFRVAGFKFFRDDYRAEIKGVQTRQAIFVYVTKGYAVAFSFAGEDQKSLDEMAKAMETLLPVGEGSGIGPGRTLERQPN